MRQEGSQPTSIGVKYQFVESAGVRKPSVGAILRIFPPSGSGGFNTSHTTGDFRLAADWDFAPLWSLNPNAGVAIYEANTGHTYTAGLFALTLNFNPTKTLNFFVDTGMQTPETQHGKTAVIVDAGVAYVIGHDTQLDVSVGTGVAGLGPPRFFWSVGVSRRF